MKLWLGFQEEMKRCFIRMLIQRVISENHIQGIRTFDAPLGLSTGAADIFGVTGGVMEAALRTVCELVTGRELPFENLHVTSIEGLEQIKTASVTLRDTLPAYRHLEGVEVRVAVTSGLAGADRLMREIAGGQLRLPYRETTNILGNRWQ